MRRDLVWLAVGLLVLAAVFEQVRRERLAAGRLAAEQVTARVLDARFEPVLETLRQSFREGRERGAQLAVFHNGELVLDAFGGAGRMDKGDTLAVVFSCTKVIESVVLAMVADESKLALDAPLARYWPAMGAAISESVTVADLMRHQAGVSAVHDLPSKEEGLRLYADPAALREFLEANPPEWTPESPPARQFYNAVTRGMYLSELVRIADGRTLRTFVEEELAQRLKLGDDLSIGADTEAKQARVASHAMLQSTPFLVARYVAHFVLPGALLAHLFDEHDRLQPFELEILKGIITNPLVLRSFKLFSDHSFMPLELANDPDVRSLPLSSAMGVANAKALATVLDAFRSGALVSPAGMEEALRHDAHSILPDESIHRTINISRAGFGLDRFSEFGCPGWIGWAGVGGSILMYHPALNATVSLVVNGLNSQQFKPRGIRLLKAVQGVLNPF